MCGQNDDPTAWFHTATCNKIHGYDEPCEDMFPDPVDYPPVARTKEELEERLQFDDIVEDALWDMMKQGLIE